jgi:hypothetical protein
MRYPKHIFNELQVKFKGEKAKVKMRLWAWVGNVTCKKDKFVGLQGQTRILDYFFYLFKVVNDMSFIFLFF